MRPHDLRRRGRAMTVVSAPDSNPIGRLGNAINGSNKRVPHFAFREHGSPRLCPPVVMIARRQSS